MNLSVSMLKRIALEHSLMPQFLKMLRGFCWKTEDVDASYVPPFQSRKSGDLIGETSFVRECLPLY
jgi:hypothetical protein